MLGIALLAHDTNDFDQNSKVVEMLESNGDSQPNWLEWSSSQLFRYSYAPPSEDAAN